MRGNALWYGMCLALLALIPMEAEAAPFCAITPTGKKCLFYDVILCRQAAGSSARCVINPDELSISEQDKGLRYCVASSLGIQCIYKDNATCQQVATRARGLCVDTREKRLPNAPESPKAQ
ncbi:MAG: hypothetical protein WBK91_03345 [Alphaproteobacteria bacterium]